jgi:hypothetical protein
MKMNKINLNVNSNADLNNETESEKVNISLEIDAFMNNKRWTKTVLAHADFPIVSEAIDILRKGPNKKVIEFLRSFKKNTLNALFQYYFINNIDNLRILNSIGVDLDVGIFDNWVRSNDDATGFLIEWLGQQLAKGYDKTDVLLMAIKFNRTYLLRHLLDISAEVVAGMDPFTMEEIKKPNYLSIYSKKNNSHHSAILTAFMYEKRNIEIIKIIISKYDFNEDNSEWIEYVKARINSSDEYKSILPDTVLNIIYNHLSK